MFMFLCLQESVPLISNVWATMDQVVKIALYSSQGALNLSVARL